MTHPAQKPADCMVLARFRQDKYARSRAWLQRALVAIVRLMAATAVFAVFGLAANTASAAADPMNAGSGTVWLLQGEDLYVEALRLQSDVSIDVSGPVARTVVKQRFSNHGSLWVEGLYVFPLPDNAAVDRYRLHIGERIIEGQLKERLQAKQEYEQAKLEGRRASLIEQQRPNVFTTSLANIAPGEEITVEFEYQQTLAWDDGIYRLRFPMVVGQRYLTQVPGSIGADGVATDVSTEMADEGEAVNPTTIVVRLDAGVPLLKLNSSYHDIRVRQTDAHRYLVTTSQDALAADRDFELTWTPELDDAPQAAVFTQHHGGYDYALVSLYPPELSALGQVRRPRDVVFVLDVSGSMDGASIEQARAALVEALGRLSPDDRFNLVWFNDRANRLYPSVRKASREAVQYARHVAGSLQSGGGTEMLPALHLAMQHDGSGERLRQLVFITDGAVDNETGLFDYIRNNLGNSRLFTVGIGSAPNAWFMKKAARYGRGSYTFIADPAEVEEKTGALFGKLESPALVDIHASIEGVSVEAFPDPIPDLYAGEPLLLTLRGISLGERIELTARYGDSEWRTSVPMTSGFGHDGVRVAWAREKLAWLMEQHREAVSEPAREALRSRVIETSLQHHLVSRFTSMVAVDVTPLNTSGLLAQQKLKTALPHGWKSGQDSNGQMMLAQLGLPQTATGWELQLMISCGLLVVALFLYAFRLRSR